MFRYQSDSFVLSWIDSIVSSDSKPREEFEIEPNSTTKMVIYYVLSLSSVSRLIIPKHAFHLIFARMRNNFGIEVGQGRGLRERKIGDENTKVGQPFAGCWAGILRLSIFGRSVHARTFDLCTGSKLLVKSAGGWRNRQLSKLKFEFSGVRVSIGLLANVAETRLDALFSLFLRGRRGLDLSDGQRGEENASGRSVSHEVAVKGLGGVFAKISFDNGFSAGVFW